MSREPDVINVQISAPGELLAALPSVLGFIPERSIILVAFDEPGDVVGATMRYDLELNDDGSLTPQLVAALEHLGTICVRDCAEKVIGVIVDDRYELDGPQYRQAFAVADRYTDDVGGITTGFAASTIEHGASWHVSWAADPIRRGCSGEIEDPATSPVAVAHAVAGGRVLQRRSEMVQMLAERPHCDDMECAIDDCPTLRPLDRDVQEECEWILDLIEDYGLALADCDVVDRVQNSLRHREIRDAMVAVAATAMQSSAEHVWLQLTRQLRGEGRAAAATLLGHLSYLCGDGAMAGICFDAALDAAPGYAMAQLLDESLRAGMRPTVMAELAERSASHAWDLGVVLPPLISSKAC